MQGSGRVQVDSLRIITSIAHLGKPPGELEPLKGIKADCDVVIFMVLKSHLDSRKESEPKGPRLKGGR